MSPISQNSSAKSGAPDGGASAKAPPRLEELPFPTAVPGFGNVDYVDPDGFDPTPAEQALLAKVNYKVTACEYEMPHLSGTHQKLLDLTANPAADIGKIEKMIAPDLALTASLLKVANSVMYGGARRIDTVRGAALLIGIRGIRSVLFSLSLRSVIFKGRELASIAEEVWRQSFAIGNIARSIAVPLCLDPERSFVLGLLHDIGKVPLLLMLREHAPQGFDFRQPFVSHVFALHHETVGRRFAQAWNLPEEVVEVAGCHHDFAANAGHEKSAALIHLAHKFDLHLSCGNGSGYYALVDEPAMRTIELPTSMRKPLLNAVCGQYLRMVTASSGIG